MQWYKYFFNMIPLVRAKSKDPHTQVGCIIAGPDNEILTTGYNSFPRGLNDEVPERMERPEKYLWIEHAERNAIYNAARKILKGSTIYMQGIPCMECARGIIQVGITKLVYNELEWDEYCLKQNQKTHSSWFDNVGKSIKMLIECGVEIEPR